MIINSAPQNEAIMSNVSEIGEFRIRNSAKAFNILSSGLYANKIRAIVRELGCNAVDSHVAAGKKDVPFDVHMPTQMEPWFAIRDYGTGLSHDQVTNIYTTYFESTKTNSNEFIGALGLGSKSPFSYTDNFTVTAIKDGTKGIYSAFINESGVPSIAQMMTEASDEPAGVEVKFAVNDNWDFSKFRDEAASVYAYFELKPVITNLSNFEFSEKEYETRDIIPGVHHYQYGGSRAVMGNIAYPIEIPNAEKNLGNLGNLLRCGLEMHFEIGELDFQASREGLSYIPQTINAIKAKLEAVNAELTVFIAKEADLITNKWERADYLVNKVGSSLWGAAADKYIRDTNFKLFDTTSTYTRVRELSISSADLAKRYNINVRAFSKNRYYDTCSVVSGISIKDKVADKDGKFGYQPGWGFTIGKHVNFVVNDTTVGATERAKYHAKNTPADNNKLYYVLEPANRKQAMNTKAFFRAIHNPPEGQIMLASTMMEKPRAASSGAGMGKNVTVMRLEERGHGGYYRSQDYVWRDAGKADTFDTKQTYYYIPLSGFNIECERISKHFTGKGIINTLANSGIPKLSNIVVYGVRKGDIEFIKTQKNWIELDTHIQSTLLSLSPADVQSMAMGYVDKNTFLQYNDAIVKAISNPLSPYAVAAQKVKDSKKTECDRYSVSELFRAYNYTLDLESIAQVIVDEHKAVFDRYPLLGEISYLNRANTGHVAEYINLIDEKKGV